MNARGTPPEAAFRYDSIMKPVDKLPVIFPQFPQLSETFIVKLWVEGEEDQSRRVWRGSITHIKTGQTRYVKGIEEITAFFEVWIKSIQGLA